MRHANTSPSYNARASRMRMRGLSKSANRTSRLIYGFCKPCTVIGLSKGERSEKENQVRNYSRTTDRISSCIYKRQIGFEDFIRGNYNFNEATWRLTRAFSDCFNVFSYNAKYFQAGLKISLLFH